MNHYPGQCLRLSLCNTCLPNSTASFAERINSLSAYTAKEAETGDILQPDHVYIAPGGRHLHITRAGDAGKLVVRNGNPVNGHKPSVDVMMQSAAEVYGSRCLGIIMTGMGKDGAEGCAAIRAAGGYVIGQDEQTSDVYGMNKVAFIEGHVDKQFSLTDAAVFFSRQVKRLWGGKSPVPAISTNQTA